MSITSATKEDWTGIKFANGWVINKKLSCAEYKKIYIKQTGDESKIIKNTHYLCHNEKCGVSTYIERTVIQRALKANRDCLSKCKGCNGERENCHYSIQCREKNLTKTPDRNSKIEVGKIYGIWIVDSIISSGDFSDHQTRANCSCSLCGAKKQIRADTLFNRQAACECFKKHSCGEILVKKALDELKLKYKTEQIFDNLVGMGGGSLRYDFALIDENNEIKGLIEFDGEQHYQENSYYNPDGKVQIHDNIKNKYAEEHNIPLLRIPYYESLNIKNIIQNFLNTFD